MRDMKLSDRLIQRFTFVVMLAYSKHYYHVAFGLCVKVAYILQRLHRCKYFILMYTLLDHMIIIIRSKICMRKLVI